MEECINKLEKMSEQDILDLPLTYKSMNYILRLKRKQTQIKGFVFNEAQILFLNKMLFIPPELMSELKEIRVNLDDCYKTLEDTHNKIKQLKDLRFKLFKV